MFDQRSCLKFVLLAIACTAGIAQGNEPEALQPPDRQTTSTSTQPATAPAAVVMGTEVADPTLAAILGATPVTLKLTDVAIADVLTALGKKVGMPMPLYNAGNRPGNDPPAPKKITVAYDNTPFWEVIQDVCKKTDLTPSISGGGGSARQMMFLPMAMNRGSFLNGPIHRSGAALTAFTMVSRQKTVNLGTNTPSGGTITGQLQVMLEPKVRICSYSRDAVIHEAIDESGEVLKQTSSPAPVAHRMFRGRQNFNVLDTVQSQLPVTFVLEYPPTNSDGTIARLSGVVKVVVATHIQAIEFNDLLAPGEQTIESDQGIRITLVNFKAMENSGNRQYIAELVLNRGTMDVPKFQALANGMSFKCTDAKGQDLPFNGYHGQTVETPDQVKRSIMFFRREVRNGADEVGTPAKFVWEIVAKSQEIHVPFEFENINIP